MKRKIKIIVLILSLWSFKAIAQEHDVVNVLINNKSVGKLSVNSSTPIAIEAKRSKYKTVKKVALDFNQFESAAAYKKSLEITDGSEKPIYSIEESATKPGYYILTSSSILKKMLKENTLKVFLLQNPRNNRMAMPSRRSLLVELHMK